MRISDWSSDVCSSDLVTAWTSVVGGRSNIGQFVSTTSSWPFLQRTVRVRIAASLQVVDQEPHAPVSQAAAGPCGPEGTRSEEHTSELQSLMRISYAVFCLKKKKYIKTIQT